MLTFSGQNQAAEYTSEEHLTRCIVLHDRPHDGGCCCLLHACCWSILVPLACHRGIRALQLTFWPNILYTGDCGKNRLAEFWLSLQDERKAVQVHSAAAAGRPEGKPAGNATVRGQRLGRLHPPRLPASHP